MQVIVKIVAATPQEVYNLTSAFQRTRHDFPIPQQIGVEPTVTVAGAAMGWVTPSLAPGHAEALLAEFERLRRYDLLLGEPTRVDAEVDSLVQA